MIDLLQKIRVYGLHFHFCILRNQIFLTSETLFLEMQKSYFWTGFLHKKSTNQKSHSESLCTVSSCEKWQAISPLLRLTISEVWTFSKDKNLYRNRAKLRCKVDCNFRICIEINEAVRSTWHWLLRQSTEMDLALCTRKWICYTLRNSK